MNASLQKQLDKLLDDQRKQNLAAYKKPSGKAAAEEQYNFLKGWAKKKPITKVGGDESTFWKCGKWMSKISPQEIAGMEKYGFAVREGDILKLKES